MNLIIIHKGADNYSTQFDIPGHSFRVQFLVSKEGPRSSHPMPPCAGLGFVHDLVRCCIPIPHDVLHSPQLPHDVKPPGTKNTFSKSSIIHSSQQRTVVFYKMSQSTWAGLCIATFRFSFRLT